MKQVNRVGPIRPRQRVDDISLVQLIACGMFRVHTKVQAEALVDKLTKLSNTQFKASKAYSAETDKVVWIVEAEK